jgi:hypothetical protein
MSHQNDSLLVVTDDRVSLPIFGRLYPFFTNTNALPETFAKFPNRLYEVLGFDSTRCNYPSLFKSYSEGIERLAEMRKQFNTLCERVCAAAGFTKPYQMRDFPNATPPMAELATTPLHDLKEAMGKELTQACVRFTTEMVATLDAMVFGQHCGVIDWMCRDACRYHYFEFKEEVTYTLKERVRSITRHVHDLVMAKRGPIPDLRSKVRIDPNLVKVVFGKTVSRKVRSVIQAVPTWLGAEYVDGQQIRDLRIERELSRDQMSDIEMAAWEKLHSKTQQSSFFRYDPAVIVGHYCLIGWNMISTESHPCKDCGGTGLVFERYDYYGRGSGSKPCPSCDGFGTA